MNFVVDSFVSELWLSHNTTWMRLFSISERFSCLVKVTKFCNHSFPILELMITDWHKCKITEASIIKLWSGKTLGQ